MDVNIKGIWRINVRLYMGFQDLRNTLIDNNQLREMQDNKQENANRGVKDRLRNRKEGIILYDV